MPVDLQRLRIVIYPEPVLRQAAEPVASIDDEVRAVAARMIELMHQADGVGLAAPQVGLSWRMFVARGLEEGEPDRVFINPELTRDPGVPVAEEEGCLSIPDIRVQIRRPDRVTIAAFDEQGQPFTLDGEGMPARVWQHETDHLDGVLIIDRMTPMDRLATRKTLKALERSA